MGNPLELVVWLPALCRKMDVPYVIVKSKARLGKIVHKKNAAVLALTNFDRADKAEIDRIIENARAQFNDNPNTSKSWGGGVMGLKTQKKLEIRKRQMEAEMAKRMGL